MRVGAREQEKQKQVLRYAKDDKFVVLAILAVVVGLGGCRHPAAAAKTDSVDAIARDYVRLALALGERDPDSVDYTVAAEAEAKAVRAAYPAYDAIAHEAAALKDRLGALALPAAAKADERVRAQFLVGQLTAIETRLEMLRGVNPGFDEEARLLFGTSRLEDTEAERRKTVRKQVMALVPAMPGKDDAERYGAYDRRFLVPGDRLAAVMRAALSACRAKTLEHVTLPEGEAVELTFTHNKPWSAFSKYRGGAKSTISINLDLPVTVDDALELACHEGYPGHHTFNTVRDEVLRVRRHWPEMEVQLTFTPQSYVSEAMAAYAPRLAFSLDERIRVEREVLFPLAGLAPKEADRYVRVSSLIRDLASGEPAVAEEYLDGKLEFVRAEQRLGAEALMDHPEAQLLYLNEYRSYMLAYTDGPRRVAGMLGGAASEAERWKAYVGVMTREPGGAALMSYVPLIAKNAMNGAPWR